MIRHCIKAALATLDAVEGEDIDLVVIPWKFNLRKEGEENSFPQELVKELLEKKHIVHFGTMLFSTGDLYGTKTLKALANILRVLGQGMKVCVEIIMMACDGECIKMGEKVLVVAGTYYRAEWLPLRPVHKSLHYESMRLFVNLFYNL